MLMKHKLRVRIIRVWAVCGNVANCRTHARTDRLARTSGANTHGEATSGVYAGDADGVEDVLAFELLDDARDGFEAQVGDVGDVLAGGQDDLASTVGEQADQAEVLLQNAFR